MIAPAPAHGVIWRKDPMRIVEKYYEWGAGKSNKSVVVAYKSMWGAMDGAVNRQIFLQII